MISILALFLAAAEDKRTIVDLFLPPAETRCMKNDTGQIMCWTEQAVKSKSDLEKVLDAKE